MKVLVSTFNQKTALVVVVGGAFSEIVKASPMQWFVYNFTEDAEPRGDIHTFRLALWSAHLGGYDPVLASPSAEECVERVKEITKGFQETYIADTMEEECCVHMMEYPIQVNDDGTVEDLPGWETFPDQGGSVAGEKSGVFPGNITT